MKVKLNTATSYNGQSLKLGDEIDIPLNVAERWINRGIAHIVKDIVKDVIKEEVKPEAKKIVKTTSHKRK